MIVSSEIARYTGSARAIAAPPLPPGPWQPEQFCSYRVLKSEISLGTTGISPGPGRPGALVHPHKPSAVRPTALRMSARNLIVIRSYLVFRPSIPEPQYRHVLEKARTGACALSPDAPRPIPRRYQKQTAKQCPTSHPYARRATGI